MRHCADGRVDLSADRCLGGRHGIRPQLFRDGVVEGAA